MDIGTVIKTARIRKGMTQEELGRHIGVQKSAVAKWENGRVSNIKRSNLKQIADILEIDVVELLGIENAPTSFDRDKSIETIMSMFRKLTPEEKLDVICYVSNIIDKHED